MNHDERRAALEREFVHIESAVARLRSYDRKAMDSTSAGPPMPAIVIAAPTSDDARLVRLAERILRLRRERERLLGDGLFADPAWDMLLDLFAQRRHRKPVSVSSLCIAAAVPATTALRYMAVLEVAGLIVRSPAPDDFRKRYVTLTESAYAVVRRLMIKAESLSDCI